MQYQKIRDLREDHDLTQTDIAQILSCSQVCYSRYELGSRDIPTDVLIRLSNFYNVSVDYLLGQSENPKRR
ncbi:MAG: helix-turn-helix transcriptional regulator [Clostridia bacterium]|jgi:transcriptional regulator with XRE-family HTH domain|nr:helix-turn-helix transcriptional regulator [Clostridia bacterium]MBP3301239.1 helix-turn-helix transcriptional regulator [Clostridia bacterium]MBQ1965615.1 helix-turn-helix transcriptional regulator [Clostridia bacterium]MBQ2272735.1 helix-turn-helix transcriptional regulator [Clostridia bacterium]MBQ5819668.1 helix-turn-helix transcriptional regulator [Clostridia bacterium]